MTWTFTGTADEQARDLGRELVGAREAEAPEIVDSYCKAALIRVVGLFDTEGNEPERAAVATAFFQARPQVAGYVAAAAVYAEHEADPDWTDLCFVRSGIQLVVDELEPLVGEHLIRPDLIAPLDEQIRRIAAEYEPFEPDEIPLAARNATHWWWQGGGPD